ncbi:hypothetical protein [Halomonas hibernica]|uniref:hypothetical protein n=1 Tax=Halomonas hibernica TaxID=2591147 RepID=UPI001555C776|nr:hypothetical protein [Halomonas hibernica]
MSDFDDAIAKAVSNIPECLAGGIDMPHFPAIRVWSGWRDVLGSLRLISLSKTGWFKPSI